MDTERFRQLPLMGILRGGDPEIIEPLVETLVTAGLETLEIAMNTPEATEMIERAGTAAAGRMKIGAGTVTDADRLERALAAGASFIVLPVLVRDVVEECVRLGVPVFPGALTPQEIHDAWRAGATMVKVFPAKFFGPAYFSEIRGPFEEIDLLACGGVSTSNAREYLAAGAAAVAFGGSVFRGDRLATRDFEAIGADVTALVAAVRAAMMVAFD